MYAKHLRERVLPSSLQSDWVGDRTKGYDVGRRGPCTCPSGSCDRRPWSRAILVCAQDDASTGAFSPAVKATASFVPAYFQGYLQVSDLQNPKDGSRPATV